MVLVGYWYMYGIGRVLVCYRLLVWYWYGIGIRIVLVFV